MKQLVILSGKGGTGKTTVASAFIELSKAKAFADCDVDAPNLHLIFDDHEIIKKTDYYAMQKAQITQQCISCGLCKDNCEFNAIEEFNNGYKINKLYCEGCGVCQLICPVEAIEMVDDKAGETILYNNKDKIFSTAKLNIGNGTSGKLVTEVKKSLRESAKDAHFAIIDGSPGIGCPVIASLSGASATLIVAEASISGLSDMKRIISTASNFGIKIFVCINKYDVNIDISNKIENYCKENKIEFVGKIPYDNMAVSAINQGKTIVNTKCKSGEAVKEIYKKVFNLLHGENI